MKYPRTFHFPWSNGGTADDCRLTDLSNFYDKSLVYTEKLDGENCVMSRHTIHARSEEGYNKPWQTHVKSQWATFRYEIPEDMEICGENLYAIHSIEYKRLTSYFYIFGIVYNGNFLSWKETNEWCQLLGLPIVPTIFTGKLIVNMPIPEKSAFGDICEGYVVRNIEAFKVEDFSSNVAKCVRTNHVQTDVHWTKTWTQAKLL